MTTLIGDSGKNGIGADSFASYADHEVLAAERMKWWGVFLIRERRRLQGIAAVVERNGRDNVDPSIHEEFPDSILPTENVYE